MTILHPIATQPCGCDRHDAANALISIDAALALVADRTATLEPTDVVALGRALGRVLARPVTSGGMIPPFDNAAMDGYAVAAAALVGDGPWVLDVVGRVPAGQAMELAVQGLSAVRIFTGAPVPDGADAVVMQEEVRCIGATIRIDRRPAPGQNIRFAGSEMAAGALVLAPGRRIGSREIAACAAAGAASVTVRRRLRIALLVTGDEVRQTGTDRTAAQIWDVNTPMLTAALTRPGIDLVCVEQGADNAAGLSGQIARMAGVSDLVVTTGGISVGEEDHVKPALQALGAEIVFSGVAIKPGKPVSFGRVRGVCWLGLPGNPLSAFITWQVFGEALVRHMTGETGQGAHRRQVVTAHEIHRKAGRCEVRPAICTGFDPQGREIACFAPETHSSRVGGLSAATGLIFLPADIAFLAAGALIEFQPFCPD